MTHSVAESLRVPVRRYRYSKLRWRLSVGLLDRLGGIATRLWRLARPIPTFDPPRRILIVQLDHLGDAVLTSPLLPRLRAAFPQARIDVLASMSNQAVFEADPNVNRVHLAPRNWFERRSNAWSIWTALWAMRQTLRAEEYDLGIDVRGDVLTAILMASSGIGRRVGWSMGGGSFLLTDVADWVPGRHEILSRLALLRPLGIDEQGPVRVAVYPEDADRLRVARLLREAWPVVEARAHKRRHATAPIAGPHLHRGSRVRLLRPIVIEEPEQLHAGRFGDEPPLLVVHLGAGTLAKRWPVRHWRTLLDRFLNDGWRVVVVGGPEDADASKTVTPHPSLRDWSGQLALTETSALLERADLFIGSDSGPAHLAACAGIPSIVLFSGTNQVAQWRPWSRRSLVLRSRVPCHPCHRKLCPLADHPCMSGIDPDRVYRAARRWWSRLHHAQSPHPPL